MCGLAKSEVGPFPKDMTGISLCLSITLQPLGSVVPGFSKWTVGSSHHACRVLTCQCRRLNPGDAGPARSLAAVPLHPRAPSPSLLSLPLSLKCGFSNLLGFFLNSWWQLCSQSFCPGPEASLGLVWGGAGIVICLFLTRGRSQRGQDRMCAWLCLRSQW